ncbi:hypothetical protein ACHAQH_009792 [Verticillium albo-atrum]
MAYDSDDSFSPEDPIFDVDEEASDAETDITEVNPLDDADCHVDVEDLPDLLDVVRPLECYRRIAEEVNNSDFDAENKFGDPYRCLKSIYLGVLVNVFTWRLDFKTGKEDRKIGI